MKKLKTTILLICLGAIAWSAWSISQVDGETRHGFLNMLRGIWLVIEGFISALIQLFSAD